jgi:hypothetical protein
MSYLAANARTPRRRLAIALTVAAALFAAAAIMSAPAGAQFLSSSQKGVAAQATWQDCVSDGPSTTCTSTDLFAARGTEQSSETGSVRGTRVCLSVTTSSFTGDAGFSAESGCATTPERTLRVAGHLASATLQPTAVTLDTYECTFDETTGELTCVIVRSREVTVSANWRATGPLARSSSRSRFRVAKCIETYSTKGESREAVATGTVDGAPLGHSHVASVARGRFAFRSICPIIL